MHMIGLARLGRDSELRYSNNGKAILQMALAFNYGQKDPQSGNKPTQWVEAALFGDRAEKLHQYLLKGTQVEVHMADPHIETYQRNQGGEGFKLVAYVNHIEFAGSAPSAQLKQQASSVRQLAQGSSRPAPNFSDIDDQIPF